MTDNALTQLSEKWRSKQGLSVKQITWLVDGYNLGYLTADETKARFCELIDKKSET